LIYMRDSNIETRVRDLLQKCTYSNDNLPQAKNGYCDKKPDTANNCDISIIGDHNIVINANIVLMTVVFVISCVWLSLLR